MPAAWTLADRVRRLLRQTEFSQQDRIDLERAAARQLRTAELYHDVARAIKAATTPGRLTLYVLLFPGEARDNTGLKDLNDNVLGYTLQQQYTARRQEEIKRIFHPEFVVVGQDFKTALFLTWEQSRPKYDTRLHDLDKALRKLLLEEFLPKSKKKGARDLERVLRKDPDYRFDVYYGTNGLEVGGRAADVLLTIHLLLTQALKGAATARYIAKGKTAKGAAVKQFARNAAPDKKLDPRGKGFVHREFMRTAGTAPAIKAFMLKPPHEHVNLFDYNIIYVDTVWTVAFFRHQIAGNPDVIRDVRKKKLVKPSWPNVKYTYEAQRQLLELWIVVLNLIDFIKDFVEREMGREVRDQHDLAVRVLENLRDPTKQVDRKQTERFLTRDLRGVRLAVLGTTSEFQFYADAADHAARIIFMMDIRDLGVEVLLMYESSIARMLDGKLEDERLLRETVRAADVVVRIRRATHELVIDTLRRYHDLLKRGRGTDGSKEAARAFKKAAGRLVGFSDDVQVMLGGDEIMIATHPRFAAHVHRIVADLSETALGTKPDDPDAPKLRIRAGVAFSHAGSSGKRRDHQLAHNKAMRLADESHGILKDLERRQRRIERLLDMLELNPNKKQDAPKFRKQLEELRLGRLFTRVRHGDPKPPAMKEIERMVSALREGKMPVPPNDNDIELIDHDGHVVDHAKLVSQAEGLEAIVRKKVGRDNVHVDNPPASKSPFGSGGDDDDDDDE